MQRLRWGAAFLVFLSGYWPLAFIILVLDADFKTCPTIGQYIIWILIMGIMLASCWITRVHFEKYEIGDPLVIKKIKDKSSDLLSYSVPYIACFTALDTTHPGQIIALIIILWLLFYITHMTHTVVINPFLISLGYKLYKVMVIYPTKLEEEITLISKNHLEDGATYRLRKLTDQCFIDSTTPDQLCQTSEPS